jgi:hypothetical protein
VVGGWWLVVGGWWLVVGRTVVFLDLVVASLYNRCSILNSKLNPNDPSPLLLPETHADTVYPVSWPAPMVLEDPQGTSLPPSPPFPSHPWSIRCKTVRFKTFSFFLLPCSG